MLFNFIRYLKKGILNETFFILWVGFLLKLLILLFHHGMEADRTSKQVLIPLYPHIYVEIS